MIDRPEAIIRINKIENKIQESNIEKKLMYLRNKINETMVDFKRKNPAVSERVIVLGKKDLSLLYKAHELLEINSDFKLEFDNDGFISTVWGMDLYINNYDYSFIGIFGKANNVIFVEG